MTERPITAAIQETVARLQQAEREAAACLADLKSIGVTLQRLPQGIHWSLVSAAGVDPDESTLSV